jgi:hypothetical protein
MFCFHACVIATHMPITETLKKQVILDAISKCSSNEARRTMMRQAETDFLSPPLPCGSPLPPCHPEVNLDHILSCVPYRDLLRDLFGTGSSSSSSLAPPPVPVVTKSYEESFMREPMWEYERPCVMGGNCECNYISTRPGEVGATTHPPIFVFVQTFGCCCNHCPLFFGNAET